MKNQMKRIIASIMVVCMLFTVSTAVNSDSGVMLCTINELQDDDN